LKIISGFFLHNSQNSQSKIEQFEKSLGSPMLLKIYLRICFDDGWILVFNVVGWRRRRREERGMFRYLRMPFLQQLVLK